MIEGLFYFFSLIIVASVIGLVFIKEVIHAAFLLVVTMVALAGVYVLFGAEYLAVVQLLVYAGGIVVLLAFGVMLTQQIHKGSSIVGHHLIFPGLLLVTTVGFALTKVIMQYDFAQPTNQLTIQDPVRQLGVLFMTDYLLAFELVAFLLLVVLVGASYYASLSAKGAKG